MDNDVFRVISAFIGDSDTEGVENSMAESICRIGLDDAIVLEGEVIGLMLEVSER